MAREIMEAIAERRGFSIVLLDLQSISLIADYFIIGSAGSARQLAAIVQEVQKLTREDGHPVLSVEGEAESGWIIMDYGGVIVHMFTPAERSYYNLEQLWKDAPLVVAIQ